MIAVNSPVQGAAERSAIDRLLRPRSIAIAGVSASPASLGGTVLDNLERFGFSGDIHLVHPTRTEVRGRACVPSASELPFGVDCIVLAIPVDGIAPALRACAARGVGGAVIFATGFAELGPQGQALQDEIAAIASAAGMAVEGPNCLGYVNYVDGSPLTFAITPPRPLAGPGVAVVSQSGAMASAVRAAFHARGLDLSFSISTGNEAVNGLEDFIAFLIDDPDTKVVAIVAEHIRQPRRFLALARTARARGIPLVMLHPGRSEGAAAAAKTHTGALTGDHAVMRVQVMRAGVLIAETLDELMDLGDCLMRCAVLPRGGTAVLGESGAFKALVLDQAEALGLELPPPQGAAAAALDAIAPGFIVSSNPLDLTAQGLGDTSLYGKAMGLLLENDRCGSLLVVIILTSAQMAARKMPPVIEAMRRFTADRAVLFAMLGEDTPIGDDIPAQVRAAGIPFFRSPERALHVLIRLNDWSQRLAGPTPQPIPAPAAPLPSGVMPEHAAKDVLGPAGLPVAPRALAVDLDAAIAAASRIGYPVALKVQARDLSHKSDVGGVILNLADEAALRAGWACLQANVAVAAPDALLDGVLVEAMSPPGLELIVGARNDADWGSVVMVGLGGVTAEALADVCLMAADLSPGEIAAELHKLKGAALLGAFRGKPARDVEAAAAAVAAVARFMRAHPEVIEMDVNPLMVFAEGGGVLALDAVMACR